MTSSPPLILEASGLGKSFVGRSVLRDVDLSVRPGEVHALLGQNGSGKSTLIKLLAGYHAPDPGGELWVGGEAVELPVDAAQLDRIGMSFVHQDLGLVDEMSVMENLRVGRYETAPVWRVRWRRERERVRAALDSFGLDVRPEDPLGALSEVERTMVAILRSLDRLGGLRSGLLVLDEPTAALPRDAVDHLFAAIADVAGRGFGVLLVTHRLEEVFAIANRATILRDGARVATVEIADLDEDALVELVLGRPLEALYPPPHSVGEDCALRVRGLEGADLDPLDLDIRRGEIVGLTGLVGMGQEEVPALLFGAETATAGVLEIGGREHDLSTMTPSRAIGAGLVLLPANRLRLGGVGAATLAENMTLPTLRSYKRSGWLRLWTERDEVRRQLERFAVVPAEPGLPLATFSGGNQQKALLAKWFATQPEAMLLHEPTQGVDVGAKSQIFRHIRDAAEAGTTFLVISSEYEDLAHLCDRVLVFRDGAVVSELGAAGLTEERIVEQCFREVGGLV